MKALLGLALLAQSVAQAPWVPDRGDGTYRNPVLAGDYSDPDVIRVGDDFYLVASSFANVPGLPILHSRDFVNWTIVGHALNRLLPDDHYRTPRRGGGVWAPAIRHHDGEFLIYWPDPDRGIFLVRAKDVRGSWSPPVLVDAAKGAIDPAPFWDDDGSAWLVHGWAASRAGRNNLITLKRLSQDGTRTLDAGRTIIDGNALPPVATSLGSRPWQTTEGPKLYKRGGYYYVFAPSGSVKGGWQGVFRSRRIDGPYEGRDVLDQGSTDVNGPHQGAWVDTPSGQDWFLHFQDSDSYGRRVYLEPMVWRDGWPVIGADPDANGRGEPVGSGRKPDVPPQPIAVPQATDGFFGPLSLAWQWNSDPDASWADMAVSPGNLRLLSASTPANLYESGNLLSQKLPGLRFTATAKLVFHPQSIGERSGLTIFGADYGWIGVQRTVAGDRIVEVTRMAADAEGRDDTTDGPLLADGASIWLRLSATPVLVDIPPPSFSPFWPSMLRSLHARVTFSYSLDGVRYVGLGPTFQTRPGRWVGAQLGLFAQAPSGTPAYVATKVGSADYDWFRVTDQ